MVVAAKNILLHLCVISNFILIGNKGLAHAQNCLKSAETVQVVKNCPENQREWEEAAQRKNCLVIQKYENCSKVEYHCLVNEFRNETIEVCTNSKYLQGYCPHYNLNEARNDYNKKCLEYSYPCNCSNRYLSTEAYKLQCCYNGTNGDSREIPIDNNSDKNSNGHLGLWIVLGIVGGLMGIVFSVFLACVIYGITGQKKPIYEALQIWRNISCKSPICACLSSGSEKDEHDSYHPLPNATTNDTIVKHGSEETNALLRGRKDNLNSVTNESPTSEEYNSTLETSADSSAMEGNSNSAKPASHLTPVTNNSNSLTSEENDPKPEATASQTQMAASSNFETYEEDGSKPEAISSEAAASVLPISNATSNSNEKSVTDNNAPVMQVSDPRTEGLCPNPIAKCDDALNTTGIKELPLTVRVKQLELDKEDLKKRLYPAYFGYMDLMIYEIKSTMQKIKAMERESSANPAVIMDKLKTKVTELEKSIQDRNRQLDELGLDSYGNDDQLERSNSRRRHRPKTKVKETPTKLEKKSLVGIHVEYRSEEDTVQISNDNEQKKEGETSAEVETFSNPKRSTDVWVEPTTLASLDDSQFDNGDEDCRFQKKTSCVQIDTAIKTFEDFREEYYESNPPADIKILEDRVSEVENDIKFLLEASRFIDSAERGKENKLDLINNSLKELNDNIDRLKKDFSFCFLENDLLSM
nr:uncharacterized protein LOC105321734 isoform X2 [Crassostrea gigas]